MSRDGGGASQGLEAKLVVLGDTGVGKTCIVLRYIQGTFSPDTTSTIGAFFLTKKLHLDGQKVKLQIWDTAGQERFRSMTPMYYRGAAAALLAFDLTSQKSFEQMQSYVEELQTNLSEPPVLAIACNKADLTAQRKVSREQALEYARSIGAIIHETSAKTEQGIDDLFTDIARQLIAAKAGKRRRPNTGAEVIGVSDIEATKTPPNNSCAC